MFISHIFVPQSYQELLQGCEFHPVEGRVSAASLQRAISQNQNSLWVSRIGLREGKAAPPMLFISYLPLRARCCGGGCSVVKMRSVFSQPNCSDNQGQRIMACQHQERSQKTTPLVTQSRFLTWWYSPLHFFNPTNLRSCLLTSRLTTYPTFTISVGLAKEFNRRGAGIFPNSHYPITRIRVHSSV